MKKYLLFPLLIACNSPTQPNSFSLKSDYSLTQIAGHPLPYKATPGSDVETISSSFHFNAHDYSSDIAFRVRLDSITTFSTQTTIKGDWLKINDTLIVIQYLDRAVNCIVIGDKLIAKFATADYTYIGR